MIFYAEDTAYYPVGIAPDQGAAWIWCTQMRQYTSSGRMWRFSNARLRARGTVDHKIWKRFGRAGRLPEG